MNANLMAHRSAGISAVLLVLLNSRNHQRGGHRPDAVMGNPGLLEELPEIAALLPEHGGDSNIVGGFALPAGDPARPSTPARPQRPGEWAGSCGARRASRSFRPDGGASGQTAAAAGWADGCRP